MDELLTGEKLIESLGNLVPASEYPGGETARKLGLSYRHAFAQVSDRTDGRYLPFYEDEIDLREQVASARFIAAYFPIVTGAIDTLTNYTIGRGFEYTAQETAPAGKNLARKVQQAIDLIADANGLVGELDREIHREARITGDIYTRVLWDGGVRIDCVDTVSIQEPGNPEPIERSLGTKHKLNAWWHGIHTAHSRQTRRQDYTRPLGFHAVYDDSGHDWEYIPASRTAHLRMNVGRDAPKGVSDLMVILQDAQQESRIKRNTGIGAEALSAIVMVRKHAKGTPKRTIENMGAANATSSHAKQTESGATTGYTEAIPPGTVKDIPDGLDMLFGPMGTLNHNTYLEVAQYLARQMGIRWATPEYMISGDASNGNYASTLVAESPFVKSREADQAVFARHFESVLWKGIRLLWEHGFFGSTDWEPIRTLVRIKTDAPEVASRDPNQQAATNEILHRNGIKSKETWAAELGLDYAEESAGSVAEPEPVPGFTPEVETFAGLEDGAPGLNGAQITAAIDVLKSVSLGNLSFVAASELLRGIGIEPDRAEAMVNAAKATDITTEKEAADVFESRVNAIRQTLVD